MSLPPLQQLEAAPLSLLVFGPGFGESILLRTPEGQWAVIDSARRQRRKRIVNPAFEALRQYGARLSLALLTHPHQDHADGFRDLIELCDEHGVIAAVEPLMQSPSPYAVADDPDDLRGHQRGVAVSTHVAIQRAWEGGRRKWSLRAGSRVQVGSCWLTALHPGDTELGRLRAGEAISLNDLSAALTVDWNGKTLVLGADCENAGWNSIAATRAPADLMHADPVKVPHHGSRNAIHPVLLDQAAQQPGRGLVVAPWNRGATLPRFEPGEGAEALLGIAQALQLTSLPFRGEVARSPMTISDVRSMRRTDSFDESGEIVVAFDGSARDLDSDSDSDVLGSWVLVQIQGTGALVVERGAGALELLP